MTGDLVRAAGLHLRYGRTVAALSGVDLSVREGETFAIVGESGCGKSTLGRALLMLTRPTDGTVTFAGEDLGALSGRALRRRRQAMQMIFQDPYASLDPRMTIGETLAEPLVTHGLQSWRSAREPVAEALRTVGLDPACAARRPHEFSGGQRQRIAIARAVIARPRLVVADEPLSALDISIQGQMLDLFAALREALGLTYVFISHDLPTVRHFADKVAVMLAGRIVEQGKPRDVFGAPAHPYTAALVAAVPSPDPASERLRQAGAAPASVAAAGPGCPFAARCPAVMPVCKREAPKPRAVAPDRLAACWLGAG